MLVVVLADLVVRLPIAEVDAPDRTLSLHHRDSAKDTRVVRRAQRTTHDFVQLID